MVKVTLEDVKEVLIADLERIEAGDKVRRLIKEAKTMGDVERAIMLLHNFENGDEVDSWILRLLMQ